MKKYLSFFLIIILSLSACSSRKLSPEKQEKILELKNEIIEIENEIKNAETKLSQFDNGLLGALIEARIEILKTNKALVDQRISSIKAGVSIKYEIAGTKPNINEADLIKVEIDSQKKQLEKSKKELEDYSGGLIAAMKYAEIATTEQTIALLTQKYLILKYGLAMPYIKEPGQKAITKASRKEKYTTIKKSSEKSSKDISKEIITVNLLKKYYTKQDYQDYILLDVKFNVVGLDKPARAIKGILIFEDLFGEAMLRLRWTIDDPVSPGQTKEISGSGFEYNMFNDSHKWVRVTALQDMKASFVVTNILYQDGTTIDFENQ